MRHCTAVPDRANEYRVTSLIEMGATGWRTAHNPVNSEILDYTDRHGMLVWSENRNLERQVIGLAASSPVSGVADTPNGMVGSDWTGVVSCPEPSFCHLPGIRIVETSLPCRILCT